MKVSTSHPQDPDCWYSAKAIVVDRSKETKSVLTHILDKNGASKFFGEQFIVKILIFLKS